MAKKENTTSIGFEDAIWRAADKLRGNLNASEYEGVVLGLIFLKYISDKFEAKFKELSEDEYADVEDKDEYEADGFPKTNMLTLRIKTNTKQMVFSLSLKMHDGVLYLRQHTPHRLVR